MMNQSFFIRYWIIFKPNIGLYKYYWYFCVNANAYKNETVRYILSVSVVSADE